MRLSEKTIELNFCSQLTWQSRWLAVWFGLTQRQEAQAGFDACTQLGGRLILFQFKASNYLLPDGSTRFYLNHDQLSALQLRVKGYRRSVYYVFPFIGTTLDLSKNPYLLSQCGLLDVSTLPKLQAPTTSWGSVRKNRIHYADVFNWSVTIHSDPVIARLESAAGIAGEGFPGADGVNQLFENFNTFWEFCHHLHPRSAGAIVLPRK